MNLRLVPFVLLLAALWAAPFAYSGLDECAEAHKSLARVVEKNHYNRFRSLFTLVEMFGGEFEADLHNLTDKDHIIDGGAGEVAAMGQYLKKLWAEGIIFFNDANVTAITYKMDPHRENDLRTSPRLNLLTGKLLVDIPVERITQKFGKAKIIIDAWGVQAYTGTITEDLQKYVDCLKPGGKIYMAVGPRRFSYRNWFFQRQQKESVYRSVVKTKEGKEIALPDYISTIPGFHVRPYEDALIIEVPDPAKVVIPRLRLERVDTSGKPPPARYFVEE